MNFIQYIKQAWKAGTSGGTPLSPDRLNHMEDGIKNNNSMISELNTTAKANKTLLGSTNISSIGGGTVTGAISELNTKIKPIITKDYDIKNNVTLNAHSTLSLQFAATLVDVSGYERISWFPYVYGQNYIQLSVNFVGNNVYLTATNEHSTTLTFDLHLSITYMKK